MPTGEVLAEVRRATRYHGVATRREFRLTQKQIDSCVDAGVLVRPYLGVYVDPARPRTPQQDLAAAVAAGGTLCAADIRSADALWDLLDDFPPVPEIVVPYRRVAKVEGAVVRRCVDLCPDHVMYKDHIRVVKPHIAVLDSGAVMGPLEIADLIVRGRDRRLFDASTIEATLARLARPGRTGVRNVRAGLAMAMIGDRLALSQLEMRCHLMAQRHGLPPMVYQHMVELRGRRYYLDFAIPELRFGIEVDGFEHHSTREGFERDTRRGNLLVLEGWLILRFTWDRITRDPDGVAREILEALGSLNARFGG